MMSVPYQSKKRLSMLKGRAERCVCRSCGGCLSLRQIDFNDFEEARIEIFCEQCDLLEFGTEPEIFTSAQYYVDEFDINFYPDLGANSVTRKMSIAYYELGAAKYGLFKQRWICDSTQFGS